MTPGEIPGGCKPALPRGVRLRRDEPRGEWMLLAPERVVRADPIAVKILERCDGGQTLDEIVDSLAAMFTADRARIDTDVRALLARLAQSKMVTL